MRYLIALACILAMPLTAAIAVAQVSISVHFAPSSDPVHHYEARIRTLTEDIRYLSPDATPVVRGAIRPPKPYWIDVRSCSSAGECGPWSDNHTWMPDLDGNGIVGLDDFNKLSDIWKKTGKGVEMFREMVTHWLDKTVWDSRLELRRYEE